MRSSALSRKIETSGPVRVSAGLKQLGIELASAQWCNPTAAEGPFVKIDWPRFLKPLSKTSGPIAELEATLRYLAACWLTGCAGEFQPVAFATVVNRLRMTRRVLCRLLADHPTLETVTPQQAQRVMQRLYLGKDRSCRYKAQTLRGSLQSVQDLYRLRSYLPTGFALDPFPASFADSFVARAQRSEPWSAPPEPVCLELIRQAIHLVGTPAEDIIRLRQKYIRACQRAQKLRLSRKQARRFARAALRGERFSVLSDGQAWTDLAAEDTQAIKRLIFALEGACALILLFLSGPRISELRRAGTGCLRYIRHGNGIEYPYFFARRSKQRSSDRALFSASEDRSEKTQRGWILGPAGVRALEVLRDLSELPRAISKTHHYWLTVACSGLWTCERHPRITVLSPSQLNTRLNAFAQFVQLAERTHWHGRLHSHMGRKSCARFIAKRDRTALEDLALQFGHLSAYVTDSGYARPDAEYRRLIEEELAVEMQQVASQLSRLDVTSTFSHLTPNELTSLREQAARFGGELKTRAEVRQALSLGSRLVPCDWGACIYRQQTSLCRGNPFGPGERRSPVVCIKCTNFVATEKHRPFWQRRVEDCRRMLAHRGLPDQTVRLVELRQEEAQRVLAAISPRS